jgi:hypothetical protein
VAGLFDFSAGALAGAEREQAERQARELGRQELGDLLGDGAAMFDREDGALVVDFGAASRETAESLSGAASRRIRDRLHREGSPVRLQTLVAEVRSEQLTGVSDCASLPDALLGALRHIRAEEERIEARRRAWDPMQDARVAFQPMWDVLRSSSTLNRCLIDRLSGEAALRYVESLDDTGRWQTLCCLDCALAAKSVLALQRIPLATAQTQVVVPVRFSTLDRPAEWELYRATLLMVPERLRRRLLLEVCGLEHVEPGDLARSVERAGELVGATVLDLHSLEERLPHHLPAGIMGLSVDLWRLFAGSVPPQATLGGLVDLAERRGLQMLAHGANTLGLATAAREAGFTHVSGTAVHYSADELRWPAYLNPLEGWDQVQRRALSA